MTDVVALIADVVGSRQIADRALLDSRLRALVTTTAASPSPPRQPPRLVAGDELQAGCATLGEALAAAWSWRLALLPEIDLRVGIGIGGLTLTGTPDGMEDGPAWWAAREAIDAVRELEAGAGTRHSRVQVRAAGDAAVGASLLTTTNAALACQDALIGSSDARSIEILRGLMAAESRRDIAARIGVTPSAVSQRISAHGLVVLARTARALGELP